ncbi:MAG: cytochrome c biogenesis protein CcdA, partial [Bacteroidota bacterium]
MFRFVRYTLFFCAFLFLTTGSHAQMIADPTMWTFEAKKVKDNTYNLIFHVKIEDKWHVFSQNPGGDGSSIPPTFEFPKNPNYQLVGKVKEKGKLLDETIEEIGTLHYYKNKVDFIQTITVKGNIKITGKFNYQTCNDNLCLPAKTKSFSFEIKDATGVADASTSNDSGSKALLATPTQANDTTHKAVATTTTPKANNQSTSEKKEGKSMLWLFLAALGGGLAAVITPCVYSMIPITVSFFTKRSKSRAEGIRNAIYYSLSIIIIFTVLGVLISAVFGSNALNTLSTNWIANLFFFGIFVLFGISFLGAFEITLPSSWTNKTDSKAGVSSFGGIFFMALTLVIVSFSCTGPIVGPLLVLAGKGGIAGPAVGMFGFSIGLALPFALFAIFPGMLNKMASSGGWLNQVKVVLGFLELMLALKFLSNADLAMGWRLLDREIFIAIWIVLAILLGIYLLGKLKLSHDDAPPKNLYGQEYVSIFKLFLAIVSFTFAVYLVPGMWGAPLN